MLFFMKFYYRPNTQIEKFGVKIYSLLVENFPQTFFVGGMVRDLLLKHKVTDIDIATEARPEQVIEIFKKQNIICNSQNKNFGVITAIHKNLKVEIATLRKDLASNGRYPKVIFIRDIKEDSKRRDFTINSLYLSLNSNTIVDFNHGIKDIKDRTIKFIGLPEKRILEDPLRILRALRFALVYNLKIEKKTKTAIKKNLPQVSQLNKSRVEKEIKKIFLRKKQKELSDILADNKLLDKYFK